VRIHSSSLSFTSATLKQHPFAKQNSTPNKIESLATSSPHANNFSQSALAPYPSEQIEPSLELKRLAADQFDRAFSQPQNTKTARALNAYRQEINQTLLAPQFGNVTPKIDIYA
jgi:hypothetical protein